MSFFESVPNDSASGFKNIAPAIELINPASVLLVDVREPDEFVGELGHIAGSKLIPMRGLLEVAAGWDRDAEIVLICRSGGRSMNCAEVLVRMGFSRVMNLAGGMIAWNRAGLAVER